MFFLINCSILNNERWTEFFWTINAVKIWTKNAERCQNIERWTVERNYFFERQQAWLTLVCHKINKLFSNLSLEGGYVGAEALGLALQIGTSGEKKIKPFSFYKFFLWELIVCVFYCFAKTTCRPWTPRRRSCPSCPAAPASPRPPDLPRSTPQLEPGLCRCLQALKQEQTMFDDLRRGFT